MLIYDFVDRIILDNSDIELIDKIIINCLGKVCSKFAHLLLFAI